MNRPHNPYPPRNRAAPSSAQPAASSGFSGWARQCSWFSFSSGCFEFANEVSSFAPLFRFPSVIMTSISLTVNGAKVSGEVEDSTLLVHFLREDLKLTGTHIGCDTSQCGCCVIHLNGRAVKSCTMFAVQA